jgi:hypothetical protein
MILERVCDMKKCIRYLFQYLSYLITKFYMFFKFDYGHDIFNFMTQAEIIEANHKSIQRLLEALAAPEGIYFSSDGTPETFEGLVPEPLESIICQVKVDEHYLKFSEAMIESFRFQKRERRHEIIWLLSILGIIAVLFFIKFLTS